MISFFKKSSNYFFAVEHDINLENIEFFAKNIPNLLEVSIGHAIICESIYLGLENVIPMYLNLIK